MPDLLALQETHLVDRYLPKIQGYELFRRDNTLHSGGLAIFVAQNLPVRVLNNIHAAPRIELLCIKVHNLNIYNVYIPPDRCLDGDDLSFINNLPKRTVLLGDFNAHHQSWSTSMHSLTNRRGQICYEAFDKNRLVLLNSSSPTRINIATNAVHRWSLLDLTLATPDIASKCTTHVTDQLLGSDHYVIFTSIYSRVVRSGPSPCKWSLGKANWENFNRLVDDQLISHAHQNTNTEKMNSNITNSLISAAENSIPRSRNMGKQPVPWWNNDCERAIRRKRAAYLKMIRSFKIEHVIAFKRRRSECRCTILNAKRQYWRDFCTSLDMKPNVSKVWRIARSLSGTTQKKAFPSLLSGNNEIVTDDKSKADILAKPFT